MRAGMLGLAAGATGAYFSETVDGSTTATVGTIEIVAVGAVVVTEPPGGDYAPGDVVTFPSAPGAAQAVTTHRVVAADDGQLQTQGDANRTPDPSPVPVDEVVGQVVREAPLVGYALVFFQQPTGVPSLLGFSLCLTLLWDLFFAAPRPPAGPRAPRTTSPATVPV